ncbi:MAG: 23S rRNA (pseudouridine(1915)-N(3))-methyltransferase RlmH [Candidatus Peribacteria bacterium]|nr:MAG: 23S rRNA (pseudouridine(1915)-N(3))-methyltransferase RlmH [Candidatus Peribacteria bacterium]
MIRIYIFADSHKHFSDAMKEYEKRLGRGVEVVLLRPSKSKDPARVIAEDTQMMIQKLEKQSGYTFVLNPLGKEYSTEQFQERIESLKQHHGNFIFAI